MRKLPHLTAVLALCATPASAEPIYRDLPKDLYDCAPKIVESFGPQVPLIDAFEKEDEGVVTHEFEAELTISEGEQSFRIVIYPDKTGAGSLEIIAREKSNLVNAHALAVMDRTNLKADAAMSVDAKEPNVDKGYETMSQRVSSAIGALTACVTAP